MAFNVSKVGYSVQPVNIFGFTGKNNEKNVDKNIFGSEINPFTQYAPIDKIQLGTKQAQSTSTEKPALNPDGRFNYYSSHNTGESQAYVAPVSSSTSSVNDENFNNHAIKFWDQINANEWKNTSGLVGGFARDGLGENLNIIG